MKTCLLLLLVLFYYNLQYSNFEKTSFNKNENDFVKNATGKWCYKVKDSIDFFVDITKKKDSIYCTYENILDNGRILNANDDFHGNDWAFTLSETQFKDTTKPILLKNYYNNSRVKLHLAFNYKKKTLVWNIEKDQDFEKAFALPKYLELKKCNN